LKHELAHAGCYGGEIVLDKRGWREIAFDPWERSTVAMNDSQPPVLEGRAKANRFAKIAATFSVLVPLVVFLSDFFLNPKFLGTVAEVLFIFLGLALGIVGLAATKHYGRKGIFGKALVGICLNGLLLILSIVVLLIVPLSMKYKFPDSKFPTTSQGRLDKATKELVEASTDGNKFYALDDAAKESFNMGKIQDAENYASELLKMAPDFQRNWNYGNAIQDGNLVLGRIAVRNGQMEEAKKYLLEAGKSPGSPTMDSFGPNMSLAKDLLEKGERDAVLQYLDQCRKFWKMDYGKLDEWRKEVKVGVIPDFGANLVY